MRVLIIIGLCAVVAGAPLSYNINQQHNPLASTATNTQENNGFLQQAANSNFLPQSLLGGQSIAQQFSTASNLPQLKTVQQQNFGFNSIQQQQQTPLTANFVGQQQQFNGFQQQNTFQQYPRVGGITKDIYVHIDPEDAQHHKYQQHALPPPPPRKHYRIVFIKAPTHNVNSAALHVQQAPIEEKTIIYVLTKKPDPADLQAAIQEIQPKQPSKPEVYFIKYKTQEEAQHAQNIIQAQYEQLGGSSHITDGGIAPVASVIGSLEGTQQQHQQQQQQHSLNFSNGSGHSSNSLATSFSSSSFNTNGSKYLTPFNKI